MTQTEKRIAIARDRGWQDIQLLNPPTPEGYRPGGLVRSFIPDYFTCPVSAVELLEVLRREHGCLQVTIDLFDNEWSVELCSPVGYFIESREPTFPAAVAEAYGRARNLWAE